MKKFLLFASVLICLQAFAEDQHIIQSLVNRLPASVRSSSGFILNQDNATEFKGLIASELYSHVKSGKIQMNAAQKLNYFWRMQDSWETNSLSPSGLALDKEGSLTDSNFSFNGYPFGSNKIVSKEIDTSTAYKVMWNLESEFWSWGYVKYQGEISYVADNQFSKVADISFERVYPKKLNSEDRTTQLFRELVAVKYPYLQQPNTSLTFRFLTTEEDMLWHLSSATNEIVQLTDSNRTDNLFDTNASLSDIWVWGDKISNLEINSLEEKTVLVAYPEINSAKYRRGRNNCYEIVASDVGMLRKGSIERWNQQSSRYFGGGGWLPTHAVYVPRSVWKIETTTRDPFSQYGRQIFYIDRESMRPVYKIIYNKSGQKLKTIILANGLAVQDNSEEHLPYTPFIIVINEKDFSASVIDYSEMEFCKSFEGNYSDKFNPRKLLSEPPKAEKQPVK